MAIKAGKAARGGYCWILETIARSPDVIPRATGQYHAGRTAAGEVGGKPGNFPTAVTPSRQSEERLQEYTGGQSPQPSGRRPHRPGCGGGCGRQGGGGFYHASR